MKEYTLTPKESAELLGMDILTLRVWIQQGKCPFGTYIKRKNARRGSYLISRSGLYQFLGIKEARD